VQTCCIFKRLKSGYGFVPFSSDIVKYLFLKVFFIWSEKGFTQLSTAMRWIVIVVTPIGLFQHCALMFLNIHLYQAFCQPSWKQNALLLGFLL